MGERKIIVRECQMKNDARKVCEGTVTATEFFEKVKGNLLITGRNAGNIKLLLDMVCRYAKRRDMPTLLLTAHRDFIKSLQYMQREKRIKGMMISGSGSQNHDPMYGMSKMQISHLFGIACDELGSEVMKEKVMLYISAIMDVISTKYEVSLLSLVALLRRSDEDIALFAKENGVSDIVVSDILRNCEAGIVTRRIVQKLGEVFENVAQIDAESKCSFQNTFAENVRLICFYQISSNQRIMNNYLMEEIHVILKKLPQLRIILDEVSFQGENDELLLKLFELKRQRKIELIVISENIKEMLPGVSLNFENICMFIHANATEKISKELFGTYQYHYPICVTRSSPYTLFSLKKEVHWQIASSEKPKISEEDLYGKGEFLFRSGDSMAVKITKSGYIYIIPEAEFLSAMNSKFLLS